MLQIFSQHRVCSLLVISIMILAIKDAGFDRTEVEIEGAVHCRLRIVRTIHRRLTERSRNHSLSWSD